MPISWLDTGASGASSEDVYRKPVLSLITQSVGMDSMLTLLQHVNGVPLVTLDHFFLFLLLYNARQGELWLPRCQLAVLWDYDYAECRGNFIYKLSFQEKKKKTESKS